MGTPVNERRRTGSITPSPAWGERARLAGYSESDEFRLRMQQIVYRRAIHLRRMGMVVPQIASGNKGIIVSTIMYGYGGSLDPLTAKTGWMDFYYPGGSPTGVNPGITINDSGGWCNPVRLGVATWRVSDCYTDDYEVQFAKVWRSGWGYFYESLSPGTWDHGLWDEEEGFWYGYAGGNFEWTGNIVEFVAMTFCIENVPLFYTTCKATWPY
jgi:hypothetical protein